MDNAIDFFAAHYEQEDKEANRALSLFCLSVINQSIKFYVNESDLDDLSLDILIHVLAKLQDHRFHSGDFAAWVHTLAVNYVRSMNRKPKRLVLLEDEQKLWRVDEAFSPSHELLLREVEKALSLMPEESRVLVEMRFWRKMTYHEIAVATGLKQCTVVKRIRSAFQKLNKNLAAHGFDKSMM